MKYGIELNRIEDHILFKVYILEFHREKSIDNFVFCSLDEKLIKHREDYGR